jgi:hypothetical protein
MKMHCPYCGFWFKAFASNARKIPALAPIVCESCAEVGLLENGIPRKLAPDELESLKQSPAWKDFIEPALEIINKERAKRS